MYHLIFVVKIKNNMKVCILGGSLSSLTLAKALVNLKINVDVLINKKINTPSLTRTLGISRKNIQYINKNIIDIEKIIWKLKKIEILSENIKDEKFLYFENDTEYLFSIVKNFKFQEILKKKLSRSKYFKIIYLKKKINYEDYNLVINTDQNNFLTRKYFNKKIEKKYDSYAYTTIIIHEKILNNTATQIFTKKGPLAFLPISNFETSIVYSINGSINQTEYIRKLIHQYNLKYKIKKIDKIDAFKLRAMNLRTYWKDNILAFGDLLHKIHPLAGQGFNMTLRDINVLVKIIEDKINLGLSLDKSVCIEFEKQTRHRNFVFSNGIDLIHELFNLERRTNVKFISRSIKMFGNNPTLNKFFTRIADEGLII